MNLISANSRLFSQAELRLFILMRKCTAIIHTLKEYDFLILGSKHPTVLFTDQKPRVFLLTQNSSPNHRVDRFQLLLLKFPNFGQQVKTSHYPILLVKIHHLNC